MLLSFKSDSFKEARVPCELQHFVSLECNSSARACSSQRFCRGSSGHGAELSVHLHNSNPCSNENTIKTRQEPQDSYYKLFNYSSWMASEMRSFLPI